MSDAPHAPHHSSRLRRVGVLVAKIAVSAALVALLAWWADWRAVAAAVHGADRTLLFAAFVAMLPTVPLAAWRWRRCARASQIDLPVGFFVRATYAGTFAGQLLPAGVGTDAVRLGFFLHRRARLAHAMQSLLLDRLVGVVTIVAIVALGLPHIWAQLPHALRVFAIGLILATLGGLAVIWALRHVPLLRDFAGQGKRRKLVDLTFAVRGSLLSRHVAVAFLVSIAMFLLGNGVALLLAEALGVRVGYVDVLAVVSMAVFVSLMPISVNGWGVREGAMVLGLSVLGVPKATALAISILFGFAGAIATVPGAFAFFAGRRAAHHPALQSMDDLEQYDEMHKEKDA